MNIVTGQNVVNFASLYLKMPFYNVKAAIGFEEGGNILGAVIFDTYTTNAKGEPQGLEATVIVVDRRCISRYNLVKLFELPFANLSIKRLQIRCGRNEKKKRRLVERLGFKFEGMLREAWPFGGDCCCYSMLKQECKFLNGKFTKSDTRARPFSNS